MEHKVSARRGEKTTGRQGGGGEEGREEGRKLGEGWYRRQNEKEIERKRESEKTNQSKVVETH